MALAPCLNAGSNIQPQAFQHNAGFSQPCAAAPLWAVRRLTGGATTFPFRGGGDPGSERPYRQRELRARSPKRRRRACAGGWLQDPDFQPLIPRGRRRKPGPRQIGNGLSRYPLIICEMNSGWRRVRLSSLGASGGQQIKTPGLDPPARRHRITLALEAFGHRYQLVKHHIQIPLLCAHRLLPLCE